MTILKRERGFTLLELMVVVGLVAILASLVMVALGTARGKGGDAGVKSNLHTIANQAELFMTANNSYLPAGGSTFSIATCPTYNGAGTNMLSKDKVIADSIAQAVSNGGNGSSCYNSSSAWAVAVGLKSSPSLSWCIDNSGASKQVSSAPASAINATTFLCN